ncbi:hypothetical protein [Mesorhizobium sp.]|uniref:hypothetical protein n=1 Tax=Mesorhizobium sp. TaxID=1871066 RepID=UPI0025D41BC4|nr:hypothetical protein [Mesorhizobium sp.]
MGEDSDEMLDLVAQAWQVMETIRPKCPQNQAPRRRAAPLGPGHTERPTVCIESAKIAADRPASCSRRSPDQAKIRSCHRCTRRIRYRRQSACPTISITAANNPRLTSIRLM